MSEANEATAPGSSETWIWRGHHIRTWHSLTPQRPSLGQVCDEAGVGAPVPVVILLHGFGASIGHWRHTIPSLAGSCQVHALDLLGFGGSDKPRSRLSGEPEAPDSVAYGFDLWAQQVVDYVLGPLGWGDQSCQPTGAPKETPLHLVGNSIGGVVALNAARLLSQRGVTVAQVVLIDCAQRALDNKRLADLPPPQRWSRPLLMAVVRQRWLIAPLFRLLATPAFVRGVLAQAYPSGANVDPALVQLLLEPSRDPGAAESFRGFVNLFNDHLAPELLAELHLPVRLLWGGSDPWEPVAEARRWARIYPCIRELVVLEGLGHCPHDEAPEQVNPILRRWILEPEQTTATAGEISGPGPRCS